MERGFGVGPNATPLIIGPRIVSASIDGKVRCLNLDDGKLLWEKDLPAEFGRRKRVEEYGYSASPLPYKGTVIVQVGGDEHAVIALKPEDGSIVWTSEPGGVSYGQATTTSLAGQDQFIYFEPEGVVGLDVASGKTLWKSPIELNNGNHLTPVVKCDENHLWVASQFLTGGARLIELTKRGEPMTAKENWFERKLRCAHWTNVRIGDYIYGSIGDNNVSFFSAFEWRTGKVAWRERGFHKAQALYADGKMVFLDEEGKLTLAEVSPGGLKVLASAPVAEPISWTLPTLDGTTLYARDRKNIMALNLGEGQ
jgi:outer membrane protein assembly factor BamB